ncbi:thioredoxin family protein [Blastococcus mobilis]|uniref:Thioredoxin domain-containing protein n=1 Tax=Blastococcus mobilis TaxID=1938746 RepID=A0A239AB79_9ACTN|nr:thioredoxin family protein [Blastococcus mobilis]SNR92123.1 Thioredoxin domain-containing protein [Blastococcus mobilis]
MPAAREGARRQTTAFGRAPQLQVYVSAGCPSCLRTRELVAQLRRLHSGGAVEVIDLDRLAPGAGRADVVGTPAYVLGGRVRWLGNPSAEELLAAWDEESAQDLEGATDHGR